MMPPKRPSRRTNTLRVNHRLTQVLVRTMHWTPAPVTIDTIRQAVQEKAQETLSR